jgi:hypothetical protein
MTDLGPDFVRAKNKKTGKSVVIHRSGLSDDYTAEPLTKEEAAAVASAGPASTLDASVRAHEEASEIADNERAAAAKHAADARALYEAESLKRRDAAAQKALDHGEIQAAAALAAVKVTEERAAARKKAGLVPARPVAADGRSPAEIDPASVRVGTESHETMDPDKPPTSGATDRRLEAEKQAHDEKQVKADRAAELKQQHAEGADKGGKK